jgi:hypothetical protein
MEMSVVCEIFNVVQFNIRGYYIMLYCALRSCDVHAVTLERPYNPDHFCGNLMSRVIGANVLTNTAFALIGTSIDLDLEAILSKSIQV